MKTRTKIYLVIMSFRKRMSKRFARISLLQESNRIRELLLTGLIYVTLPSSAVTYPERFRGILIRCARTCSFGLQSSTLNHIAYNAGVSQMFTLSLMLIFMFFG